MPVLPVYLCNFVNYLLASRRGMGAIKITPLTLSGRGWERTWLLEQLHQVFFALRDDRWTSAC